MISLLKNKKLLITAVSVLLLALGIFMLSYDKGIDTSALPDNLALPEESLEPSDTGGILAESKPVQLRIPNLQLDAPVIELGLKENNEIEVPKKYDVVGWYKYGPTPGELGPAVILGHVAAEVGPGVFGYLRLLEPGDLVEVDREDGSTAIFRVDKLESYPQNTFPTSLVYGDLDYSGLRLITCTGKFNEEDKTFDMNLIVFASLIGTK
ncbi:MAG: hypothetical protein A3G58_00465 [Candidatus Colwellbacteria bacterium RIFCSPLOWO2_12_FULL_46_17]|uniref:Sortase family enzyme n=2 Tax=Parcubacteria group TaxID=1794811 RepID=A0A0H4T7T3_9BACT|nr:Sortase family enzyme [uncultured Parcubacteria bacterium Rifle_16ft_4_minimus_37647]OGY62090.1 MAG: hypothetical protein A3G58_00465 [Candidatus Colwellbacteria bacterium RIFCSPLOWO2_12_FULL_46_17]